LFLEKKYVKLIQTLVKLKYKPRDAQKIKINVDKEQGPPLLPHHKILNLNYGPLKA